MADVIDVTHRINYEVNDASLQNATKLIQAQITELDRLNANLKTYTSQIGDAMAAEGKGFDALAAKISNANRQVEVSVAKTEGLLTEMFKGVTKGFGFHDNVKDALSSYIEGVRTRFTELSKTTQGVASTIQKHWGATATRMTTDARGMTTEVVSYWNNVSASATGGSAKSASALASLGKSLVSVTGLLDIGINVAFSLGEEMKSSAEKIGIVTDKFSALSRINVQAAGDIAKVTTEIGLMKDKFFSATATIEKKKEVVKELNEKFGDTIGKISNVSEAEDFFINKSDAYIKALTLRAQAQAAYNLIIENNQKLFRAKAGLPEDNLSVWQKGVSGFASLFTGTDQAFSKNGKISNVVDYIKRDYNATANRMNNTLIAEAETETARIALYLTNLMNSLLEQVAKIDKDYGFNTSGNTGTGNTGGQSSKGYYNSRKAASRPAIRLNTPEYTDEGLPDELKRLDDQQETERKAKKEAEIEQRTKEMQDAKYKAWKNQEEERKQQEADAAARRKQNTLDAISDYQTLAQSVADAYNTIVQVQINALDKEIAIREKRVEAAQKLAERGNVEALRMEEERLRQAQNMREQFARRQQIVNSAITVSNAIAAVARAALEGGGFGSAATIAALIAALAAGYAAVSSMSNDNAFADGVVDYKGKGGPRDDANWVRISSGESVITADGTKANRHILEAINSGAQFKLMNPALPYTMPMFRSPDGSGVYASAQDLGALESKLDNVVNAIEDNRLRQNIYFNEHGVGIMTEKAIRRDRRRWL